MNPLFFFIVIIVFDLILKSVKDKQKIEQERKRRTSQYPQTCPSKKQKSEDILTNLNRKMKRASSRTKDNQYSSVEEKGTIQEIKPTLKEKDNFIENKKKRVEKEVKVIKADEKKKESKKKKRKNEILRGIIYSEILSEPKSIRNQKRSM